MSGSGLARLLFFALVCVFCFATTYRLCFFVCFADVCNSVVLCFVFVFAFVYFQDVPDELLPRLVEKLHGKADKREDVVNAFVAMYPHCTKKAVRSRVVIDLSQIDRDYRIEH